MLTVFCSTMFAQNTVTFDATADSPASGGDTQGEQTVTKDGITVTISSGMMNGEQWRCYKGQTMTVTSTVGNITKISVTCTANGTTKYGPGCFTAASGEYTYETSGNTGTWTGDAAEVVMTAESNQVRMTAVEVTYSGSGSATTKKSAKLAFSETSIQVEKGGEFTAPTFTKETTAAVTFASDNEEVATVSSDGVIALAGGLGTAVITATSEDNDEYEAGSTSCKISVYTNNVYTKVTTVTSGKEYLIVAQRNDSTMYAYPYDSSKAYGYLSVGTIKKATDTITVKSLYDDAFTITGNETDGYTIVDAYGRQLYQNGKYNTFSFSGAEEAVYAWTIEPQTDGTFKISMNDYFIQWGQGTYKTFGVYQELQDNAVLPMLYQLYDGTTGIETVNAAKKAANDNAIYNLAGQRLQKMQKGINIVGGKKIILK